MGYQVSLNDSNGTCFFANMSGEDSEFSSAGQYYRDICETVQEEPQPFPPPCPVRSRVSRARVVQQHEDKALDEASASAERSTGKHAIAWFQEFLQGSKDCKVPSRFSVLQWSYEERMAQSSNLEFRATVRFLLDRIPHHATGTWQSGKKAAMRDAADRACTLFVTRWGEASVDLGGVTSKEPQICKPQPEPEPEQGANNSEAARVAATLDVAQELVRYCRLVSSSGQSSFMSERCHIHWNHEQDNQGYIVFVEFELVGVSHKFGGPHRASLSDACEDTARRVLWYLQCPGYEDVFEPNPDIDIAKDIPEAPKNWIQQDTPESDMKEEAEEKTAVMRLQNRLQQAYSKLIPPGTPAIRWEINRQPPMICAIAKVPAVGKEFCSELKKSQREAKIDACKKVFKFLDENPPERCQVARNRKGSFGSGSSGP